ncbi:type IX secretion system membrane protein PorP/SprF [Mucilaginibacter sp. HMF5004]|uniref:PorP/SprF family type IX secretion system membrane protein n=1 Tax=Mucilaginibacter rivuli TaxID=2857527 RepID=UPI001C5E79AB|nr:type IX secretion system membrane protein PorP/SprF [Mucilaginibacter rivuli]MBW4889468.1 type IX secretion system membrane protein PorP/SprF [Mucilaginibacter rivuli]
MKRVYLLFCVVILALQANAQQKPQYTQYIFSPILINPAVTGIENYTDVKAGYRSQWTGLQGAPVTSYFTINAPLGRDFIEGDAAASPTSMENPLGRSFTSTYRAAAPHHGIGLTVVSDKAGPIRQTNVDATYAYHIGISPTLNLAVGVSAGIYNITLNTAEVTTDVQNDPAINGGNNNQIKPDVGAGIWAYSSTYFFGASVQQILPQTITFSTNSAYNQGKAVPHYFLSGGVKLFLSDDVTLLPSVLVKLVEPVPFSYDINMKMAFRDHFWIGGSYRQNDAVAGMIGFNLGSFISLGYSYDYTTSNLNTVSTGTHEIVLGLFLNNRYNVTCPRRSW